MRIWQRSINKIAKEQLKQQEDSVQEITVKTPAEGEDGEIEVIENETEEEEEEEYVPATGEQLSNLCLSPGQETNINAVLFRYALRQADGDDYEDPCFMNSGLDGRYLDKAEIRINNLGIIDIVLNF